MPKGDAATYYLSLNECPHGHGVRMISLDHRYPNGDGSGTRLTNQKCCGSWTTVQQWPVSRANLREIGELMIQSAEEEV